MASEHFSLSWDDFHRNMSSGMNSLLESEDLVDVTIAVEGRYLKAHKMVLSVCSPYFRELFKVTPCKHPIVFLKDVSYNAMSELLQFMYQGKVQVSQENLTTFFKAAEALQVKGLTNDGNGVKRTLQEQKEATEPEEFKSNSADLQNQTSSINPAPKKLRLESSAPVESLMTKTEPAVEKTVSSEHISFKFEPCDENQSLDIADDNNFDENLIEDPLDMNEDNTMMESGDEELKKEANTDWTEEDGQASNLSDYGSRSPEAEVTRALDQVSAKTSLIYQASYQKFIKWCNDRAFNNYSESVLCMYFSELATKMNMKSSSMWSHYSMIKSLLKIKHGIDIRKYIKLRAYLKKKSEGYIPKKSKIFTKDHIDRFLAEASDEKYLGLKVVLIIGVSGGCTCEDMVRMKVDDIKDLGTHLQIRIPGDKTNNKRSFTVVKDDFLRYYRKYASLRPDGMVGGRFFLKYENGKCHRVVMGSHKIGGVPREIASFLKLPDWQEYTGHSFKRTSATLQ